MTTIITHNGTFHADEITAIALLQVFKPAQYSIKRLPHQSENLSADYVIDIGREYDNITKFDHHQWEGGKSSAGLIWEYIGKEEEYPELSKLIKAVDDNDVGIQPATQFEYSRLISTYNSQDIHDDYQLHQFHEAVNFAYKLIQNIVAAQKQLNESKLVCNTAPLWPGTEDVLNLGTWQLGWNQYINGETRPEIEAVVWKDEHLNTWNIQTTNKSITSYDKVGKQLLPWDKMNFVHSNNFFAVAATRELMDQYINNYREI